VLAPSQVVDCAGGTVAAMEGETGAVVVVGAGGHALVAVEVLRSAGRTVAGCVSNDGRATAPLNRLDVELLGDDATLDELVNAGDHEVFIAIGDNHARRDVTTRVLAAGARLTTAISPAAIVSPAATVAAGALVMPGVVVNALATIGQGAIVNTGASVDHECGVSDYAHLAPRSALAGNVRVGEGALVGIGAAVLPGRSIGAWSTVGAGAVVTTDVPANTTVVGIPARATSAAVKAAEPTSEDSVGDASSSSAEETRAPTVLVVCTGNLCRSPVAAALLERQLAQSGIDASIESAGTGAPLRQIPDRRLLKAARDAGLDLNGHRSEQLTAERIARADLILTMSAGHDAEVATLDPAATARTVRLRRAAWKAQVLRRQALPFAEWVAVLTAEVPPAERAGVDASDDIDDPIGGPMRAYRQMTTDVGELVDTLVRRWSGR